MTAQVVAPPRARPTILLRQPTLVLAVGVVVLVVAWSLVPGAFTSFDPYAANSSVVLVPPNGEHLFGTDRLGRDVFTRTVHGSVVTLSSTLLAVLIASVVGSLLGLVSGFFGGLLDLGVMRLIDTLLAVPVLLVALVVVSALGYSTFNVALAVGISAIASFARVMRAEVLKVTRREYVEAAQGIGASRTRVVLKHLLPNSMSSVISLVPLEFGRAVLSIAALGFLGFGAPPPRPEWGQSVSEGRDLLATSPWISLLPGLVVLLVVLSSNRISRAIERARVKG